ncbi:hypothetical protein [Thalassospira sp.]|uniref:hypothetical protein n=1 Tax=Thalassospira sp. TaxID=1912094 RepID=UPI00257F38B8|nr:hypothetical protein [Thalassospira sp.]
MLLPSVACWMAPAEQDGRRWCLGAPAPSVRETADKQASDVKRQKHGPWCEAQRERERERERERQSRTWT